MQKAGKTILLFLISFILFVAAFNLYGTFLDAFFPLSQRISLQVTELNGPFINSLLFALVWAIVPLSLTLIWKLIGLPKISEKLLSVLIIIACMIIVSFVRCQMILSNIIAPVELGKEMKHTYTLDDLNFERFLFLGLCAGCLFSFFLFRNRSMKAG